MNIENHFHSHEHNRIYLSCRCYVPRSKPGPSLRWRKRRSVHIAPVSAAAHQQLHLRLAQHGVQRLVHALGRSEEHTSELQSPCNLVCRLLLEKKKHFRSTNPTHVPPPAVPRHRWHARQATSPHPASATTPRPALRAAKLSHPPHTHYRARAHA